MTDVENSTLIRIGDGLYVHDTDAVADPVALARGDELHVTVTHCETGQVVADGFRYVASETDRDVRKAGEVVETQKIFTAKAS